VSATGLRDTSALVTGAASGIGRATCLLLGEAGARVAAVDVDGAGAENTARAVEAAGGEGLAVEADVADGEACRRAAHWAADAFGATGILVNAAGVTRRGSVLETDPEDWDRVMTVNVRSAFLLGREVLPAMIRRGAGSIVNVASGWGLVGGARAAAYCASKGALVQLTRAMAIDHGPAGVRINCVCPGDTDTPLLRGEARELGEDEAAFLHEAADRPLGRIGTPGEVARAILFLAGDDASFVTGACLTVDGGGLAGG